MAKSVFFSFHYKDVASFRVNVVRNSGLVKQSDCDNARSFSDGSLWEKSMLSEKIDLQQLIQDKGLYGTSITAVLIGSETYLRPYVRYEVIKSFEKGNGILAIHLNRIKGSDGRIIAKGKNPLDYLGLNVSEQGVVTFYELIGTKWEPYSEMPYLNNRKSNTVYFGPRGFWEKLFGAGKEKFRFYKLSEFFQTYCWQKDDGYNNFGNWIGRAQSGLLL